MQPDPNGAVRILLVDDDPDDFDYNEFVDREFGRSASIKPAHLAWKWWLTGIILLALMIAGLIRQW